MDALSSAGASAPIADVTQVLINAQQKTLELAEKLIKVNAEMVLACQPGMGENIDVQA